MQERLQQDFGIVLPEIPEERSDDWCPSSYFDEVKQAISKQREWSVDRQAMLLGFFSFAKFQMYRDMDVKSWPEGWLEKHGLFGKILGSHVDREEREHQNLNRDEGVSLDSPYAPADLVHVLDADSSQTRVIDAVRKGENLVVQGPPGTGKSQTIANILAAAVHDGKTVLFVAEKMADPSVVYKRLVECGLEDICIELHSHRANKKLVIQEFDKTLRNSRKKDKVDSCVAQPERVRNHLNHCDSWLHEPLEGCGGSPYEALCEIIGYQGASRPAPSIPQDGLEKLGKIDRYFSDIRTIDKSSVENKISGSHCRNGSKKY